MFKPTLNTMDEMCCTFRCTNSRQLSPTTLISPTQQNPIHFITHVALFDVLTVAPNVAGSIPVSHPKHPILGKFP